MGQAKYRKKTNPNYGSPNGHITMSLTTGYPDYYPDDLVSKLESISDDQLSDEKISKIYDHLGHLGDYCQKLVVKLNNELYNLEPMRVAFATLTSTKMGAFAYTSIGGEEQEKFDFIGINLGTPAVLLSNFYKILSSPSSFLGYGSNESEDPERAIHFLSVLADPDRDFVPPLCPVRKEFAILLTQIALDFVLLHEATHLYHGHVDWIIKNRSGEPSAIDSFNNAIIPSSDLARQFFEIDADDCALQLTTSNILEFSARYNAGEVNVQKDKIPAYDLVFGSKLDTLKAVLYSLYILHRSGDYEIWHDKVGVGSHPRGLLRARYMFNRFIEVVAWHGLSEASEQFMDICIAVVLEAEQDIARMEARDVDIQTFRDVMCSSNASAHIQAVGEIQPVIEDETYMFVRGNLFPSTAKMKTKAEPGLKYRGARRSQFNRP